MSTRALKRKRLRKLQMKDKEDDIDNDDEGFKNQPPKKKSKILTNMSSSALKRKHSKKLQTKVKDDDIDIDDKAFKNQPPKTSKIITAKNTRVQQLLEANKEEDKNIKRLEALLKIDKKKKKKLPSVFKEDGLDFILEAIEGKDSGFIMSDDSCDFEEDIAALKGKPDKRTTEQRPQPKKRTLTQLLNETEGVEEQEPDSDDGSAIDEDEEDELNEEPSDFEGSIGSEEDLDESKEQEPDDFQSKEEEPKVWEDIYGRLRDESGNVLKGSTETGNVYVPPKLRKQNGTEDCENEVRTRIKRNLKGLINRLSESNLQNICHQIEEMYRKHSRNDMNETLFCLMSELLFTASLTPPRLVMEQAMLVSLLHANIGSEVGAFFLQSVVEKIGTLLKASDNYGEGKEFNNVLLFLSNLYIFKVTHSTLMFDIFLILVNSFSHKDIELIQLLLKNIGFGLRKDDPLKLKELVFSIKDKASSFSTEGNDSRVKFMLETLTAIRNNNIYKVPDYDPSIIERCKKFLRGLIRKGCSLQELSISYEDLLKAREKGRWWIVGSAWVEPEETSKKSNDKQAEKPKSLYSDKILELARKQHMNTDTRKSIFCILMTSEDFMDAFEKLLKLSLKNQQEREIINVILHCVIQEKTYNPYYAHLLDKFCTYARKHQICLQFSLWDKFKEVSNMKSYKLNNIARLLSHLFICGALPISVLKVIHFSDMDKPMVRFFRQILLAILLHESEEVVTRVFTRISRAENLKLLRESLKLFMHHFILKNQSKLDPEEAVKLDERVKLAKSAMKPPTRLF